MRNWYWIVIGAAVGLGSGAIFGVDYALAGLVIGIAAGGGIMIGMKRRL